MDKLFAAITTRYKLILILESAILTMSVCSTSSAGFVLWQCTTANLWMVIELFVMMSY